VNKEMKKRGKFRGKYTHSGRKCYTTKAEIVTRWN